MNKIFGLCLLVTAVAFAVTALADAAGEEALRDRQGAAGHRGADRAGQGTEKPTKEFSDIMKANGDLINIKLGMNPIGNTAEDRASLSVHIKAKDYNGIAKDAATLKANLTKIQAFWAARKVDDAIEFSKAVVKAATDLEAAASAKDDAGIITARRAIVAACVGCHNSHRALVLSNSTYLIIID